LSIGQIRVSSANLHNRFEKEPRLGIYNLFFFGLLSVLFFNFTAASLLNMLLYKLFFNQELRCFSYLFVFLFVGRSVSFALIAIRRQMNVMAWQNPRQSFIARVFTKH
jgi:hypothetical protein